MRKLYSNQKDIMMVDIVGMLVIEIYQNELTDIEYDLFESRLHPRLNPYTLEFNHE